MVKPTPAPPKDTGNTTPQKVAAKPATSKGKGEQSRTVADRFKKPVSASKGPSGQSEQAVQTTARTQSPQGNSGKRTGSRAEPNPSSILKSGPNGATKRKRSRSSSKAREAPKRNKDMQVDELLGQLLSSLQAKMDKNNTGGRKQSKPKVKFAKQSKEQAPRVVDDEANIIIMGDSQLATDIAARLDAKLIASVAHDNYFEQLRPSLTTANTI